jgi:hypothetical protein
VVLDPPHGWLDLPAGVGVWPQVAVPSPARWPEAPPRGQVRATGFPGRRKGGRKRQAQRCDHDGWSIHP